jgi:hypothetical protein
MNFLIFWELFVFFVGDLPEDPVFTPVCFITFFSMVVPSTNCSQKKFGKFLGLKKGDLVPG